MYLAYIALHHALIKTYKFMDIRWKTARRSGTMTALKGTYAGAVYEAIQALSGGRVYEETLPRKSRRRRSQRGGADGGNDAAHCAGNEQFRNGFYFFCNI